MASVFDAATARKLDCILGSSSSSHALSPRPSCLTLSIDYGTKNLTVAFCLGEPDGDIYKMELVQFSYIRPEATQCVAWTADGAFLWGYQVLNALSNGMIRQDQVIELWKLALYKDAKTDLVAKHVNSQLKSLGKCDVSELVRVHLAAIIKEAKRWICEQEIPRLGYDLDVEDLPVNLFLNVPQVWSPPATRVMVNAAEAAGVRWVDIVYEAESAVGYYVSFLKRTRPGALGPGDTILVADLGGRTGDFGLYELVEGSDAGAIVTLKCLAKLKGEFCGSQFVNDNFIAG